MSRKRISNWNRVYNYMWRWKLHPKHPFLCRKKGFRTFSGMKFRANMKVRRFFHGTKAQRFEFCCKFWLFILGFMFWPFVLIYFIFKFLRKA